jgi:hypothetical protein
MEATTVFKVKSRFDCFNVPTETLPEGLLIFKDDKHWFMTSKKYLEDSKILSNKIEQLLMYGKILNENGK